MPRCAPASPSARPMPLTRRSRRWSSPAAACAVRTPARRLPGHRAGPRCDRRLGGRSRVDRILKDIPQNFDLGVSENSRGQSGGAGNIVYGNTVNLRGIGPYATLVLVDGHRVTNNTRSIDPSIMPTLGVERVEVVADGASAIYGSDAVAGVVNLIPRRTLDGVEVFGALRGSPTIATFTESGARRIAAGKVWDRGQVMLAYEHATATTSPATIATSSASDQTAAGGRDYRVTRCNPGTLRHRRDRRHLCDSRRRAHAGERRLASSPASANRCDDLVGPGPVPGADLQHRATYRNLRPQRPCSPPSAMGSSASASSCGCRPTRAPR